MSTSTSDTALGPCSVGPAVETAALRYQLRSPTAVVPITQGELESTLNELDTSMIKWPSDRFKHIETLADAMQNHGRVDLMDDTVTDSSRPVQLAVKRMPNKWTRSSSEEFRRKYPKASERPWEEVAILKLLNARRCPHVCDFIGVFRGERHTYMAMELCTGGELFHWCKCSDLPEPGLDREVVVSPLMTQIFSAVRYVHAHGIAHRDLSLENILLSSVNSSDNKFEIKIVDFGKATSTRFWKGAIGKRSYQSPEMHLDLEWDAFLADAFALGVVLFATSVTDVPWFSTKIGGCLLFDNVATKGFLKHIQERKLKGKGKLLAEVLSEPLVGLLAGLLEFNPRSRATLSEPCSDEAKGERRMSVWDFAWLPKLPSVTSPKACRLSDQNEDNAEMHGA
jgi:serine/threonine protein kinase